MHFFHPRFLSTQPFQSAAKPRSEWAKAHAIEFAQMGVKPTTISDSRTSVINFLALQRGVEVAMGQACIAIEWVAEGGGNQLYLVTLSDGHQILARIAFPFPHSVRTGAAFAHRENDDRARIPARTQSEVATIRHIRTHTDIPVARIYAYDNTLDNAVGAPYTLQEMLSGGKLANRWKGPPTLTWYDAAIQSLGSVLGKTLSLPFDGYGSLQPSPFSNSVLGSLIDPILSLHRHHPLSDTGPWPANEPLGLHLSLAVREAQWLESPEGQLLFNAWHAERQPAEDRATTLPAFLELARTLAAEIIPHMYALFPVPENVCRPALSHPDFHSNNILVSSDNPAHITGVVDWEFASILPLWAAYTFPSEIEDLGDEDEFDPLWRAEKKRLRGVFAQEVVRTCPEAAWMMNEQTEQSIRGLRLLVAIAVSGVALYYSFKDVGVKLVKIRECVKRDNGPVVEKLDHLVTLFSQSV